LIAAWIGNVLAEDVSVDHGKILGKVSKRHGWSTSQRELLELFDGTSNGLLERHARLLADWSLRKDDDADRETLCAQPANRIMWRKFSTGRRNST
jgi:hypothetical protein